MTWLTIPQAARLSDRTPSLIYKWVRSGELAALKTDPLQVRETDLLEVERAKRHRASIPRQRKPVEPIGGGTPCQQSDPELWFSFRRSEAETALQHCRGCPTKQACLRIAIDTKASTGIWGGEPIRLGKVVSLREYLDNITHC